MNEVVRSVIGMRDTQITTEVLVANREGRWLLSYNLRGELPTDLQAAAGDTRFLTQSRRVEVASAGRGPGWTIMLREDADNALRPIREARRLMLLFTLGAAAAFALLSWWAAGRVVRPIVQLATAVERHAGEPALAPPARTP